MKLLIISSVVHFQHQGQIYAYGPYAREIEVWADLFDRLDIAAPVRMQSPPADTVPLERRNIRMVPQKEVGGESLVAKLGVAWNLPAMVFRLGSAIAQADAVHVRCPGNLGLLGVVLSPLLCRYRIAKYAGQWNGHPGEPLTVRFQRWALGSRYWNAPVTVYGEFPGQPAHVISYFTSIMTRDQLESARAAVQSRKTDGAPVVLYTGRLSKAKNVDILLKSLAELRDRGLQLKAQIVGEGPERESLEALSNQLGLGETVTFMGGLAHEEVLALLRQSHALVLASETEGWPKSLAEGMAHGLICIGSNRGLIPSMLSNGRGFTVPVRDVPALTELLCKVATNYETHREMGVRASEWACRYSLEGLRDSLRDLLTKHWRGSSFPLGQNGSPS